MSTKLRLMNVLVIFVMLFAAFYGPSVQTAQAAVGSPDIVIRQVYGGGGNSGATYKNDFIELYNRGTVAVDITGWSVQYASATGTFTGTTNITPLSGTIAPGAYYLIQEAAGTGGTVYLPSPDATGSLTLSGTNGKVALANIDTALSGTCPTTNVVDFFGYGTANCSETAPTAALSNTTAALRNGNGATDTDNNSADFTIGAPAPRTMPSGTGLATPASGLTGAGTLLTVTVTPGASPASTGITVTADLSTIGGSATQAFFDDATNGDVTAGDNIFSFQATATGTPASLSLPATIADAQSRSGATTIAYQIISPALVVSSTNPANAATDVAVTSPFAITFSESVNVGTDWYTFTCDGNPVAATNSAAPAATITLTPGANLPYHTACTVTVDPSKVSSVSSGGTSLLTGTNTWSFTTQWQPVNVTTTEPANGATGVAVDTTFEINFNQSVLATPTWYTFTCNGNPVASTVAPTGVAADTYIITPSANLPIMSICTVTLLPSSIISATSPVLLTGTNTFSFSTISPDGCPVPPITHLIQPSIGAVQGTGLTAAKTGNLTLKGTITNRSINGNGATPAQYGFFIQDAGDSDPLTSDGMFVYTTQGSAIPVGSAVMVTGAVSEFNKGTQLTPVASGVVACGTAAPIAPVTVNLPDDSDPVNLLERFENMLVHMPQEFTIAQNYFQGRYGQLTVSPGGRLFNPTNGNLPGTPAEQIAANNRRMIVLDDNNYVQNPTITPYLGTGAYPYADIFHPTRAGDLILGGTAPEQGLTGILDQGATNSSAGAYSPWYRIQPTVWPTITRGTNLRTAAPVNPGGNVKVAGFNLLNYFTTLDKEPERSTPPYNGGSNTPRGADSQTELDRQRAKTVAAIIGLGADVTGVIEVENNGETAISDLVDYLNLATAPGTYDYVRDTIPLPPTSDFIKAAIIYKPMAVTPVGASVWSNADIFDRPPLAQTFKSNLSGEKFSVVVNHFKSKGSCPASGDVDLGQGCWNLKRTEQAVALLNFINTTLVPVDPDVIAVGDYNAYGAEDPINTLTNPATPGALINELLRVPSADRYTYVFDGQAGYLDHMLLTSSLDSQVTGVSIWHLNADESGLVDYNTEFKTTGSYPPDPYDGTVPNRASDHDPILIGLNLNNAPQVANPIANQAGVVWRPFQFTFAENVFSDANLVNGDKLTYTADLESGAALPAWLQFNATTRTFSGTPIAPVVLRVRVTATDQSGASVSTVFTLNVKAMYWHPVIRK